jgi:hypothetical protein
VENVVANNTSSSSSPIWNFFVTLVAALESKIHLLREIYALLEDYFTKSKSLTELMHTVHILERAILFEFKQTLNLCVFCLRFSAKVPPPTLCGMERGKRLARFFKSLARGGGFFKHNNSIERHLHY